MDESRSRLLVEFWMNLIPIILICFIFIAVFVVLPKFCKEIGWSRWLDAMRVLCLVFALMFSIWSYGTISTMYLDLKESAFIEYYGEIEYQEGMGDRYNDYFELSDIGVCVESLVSIQANIQRCEARVVYTKHSQKALAIDVYRVLETRPPIDIR